MTRGHNRSEKKSLGLWLQGVLHCCVHANDCCRWGLSASFRVAAESYSTSPDENLADGAAEVASSGFFDVNNVPPWDAWVAFIRGTLISWVPLQLVTTAQLGIDVNPEACVEWFEERPWRMLARLVDNRQHPVQSALS